MSGLKTTDDLRLASVGSAGTISSTYTYNTAGRLITAATNGNPSESFSYDPSGNIQTAGSTTFLYETDQNGVTLLHNSTGGYARYYFFDPAGKWRTVQAPTDSQSDLNREQFAYTGTGRLATYAKYTSGSIILQGAYTYDAQGQRTKSVVGPPGGLITTTEYAYSGLLLQSLSASQTGTGATTWKITYLYDEYGRPYGGVYRSPATSTAPVFFGMVVTDRGDVVELLDASGAPFAAYRYDAWGNPQGTGNVATGIWSQSTALVTSQLASAIAQRQVLRYASYCFDSESGMYYLSSRHYDPKTRQFLSKDLSRNDGEQSAYQYCLGNPIANVDPTGYAVVREAGRPLTPQERADTKNRMLAARAKWYADHKKSTAKKIGDALYKYCTPMGWGSMATNKASKHYGILYDFVVGSGPRERYYGASTEETQQMMATSNVQKAWQDFKTDNYADLKFRYSTQQAFEETPVLSGVPFNSTPAQVGGYDGATIRNNGDGTATVTINNTVSWSSLLYHLPGIRDNTSDHGPGSNIYQTFQWTWPLTYGQSGD